jgi:hypothetical protein
LPTAEQFLTVNHKYVDIDRKNIKREDFMAKNEIETLKEEIELLRKEVKKLKDTEEINILQKAYGYYLEHWMAQEIIDLFSDAPDVSLTLGMGTYLGKEGIKRYFNRINPSAKFLHQVMLLSGIVHVEDDGKNAKGRWFGWGSIALPGEKGVRQGFFDGIYTCDYIKENDIWKIKTMRFDELYGASPARGWVDPKELVTESAPLTDKTSVDIPRTVSFRYPAGLIVPFHFAHPVTGQKTSEEKRNAALQAQSK